MGHMSNQHFCPRCDGFLNYEGCCHTCGYRERQYAERSNVHPRVLRRVRVYNVRYGCS